MNNNIKNLFGTDGIRGVIGVDFTPSFIFEIGKAVGIYSTYLYKKPKILIGTDTRISKSFVTSTISSALTSYGADIVLGGILPTPAISYLVQKFNFDFGISITASHNPSHYNGIKIFNNKGEKLDKEVEKEISYIFTLSQEFNMQPNNKLGNIKIDTTLKKYYLDYIKSKFDLNLKNKKILLDCANGALSKIAPKVLKQFGANVRAIGNNIKGEINKTCGVMYIDNIKNKMKKDKYDIAFSFDGDGDRIIAILPNDMILDGDKLLYLFTKWYFNNNKLKGSQVAGTVITNYGVENTLSNYGISLIRTDVGDKHLTKTIIENNISVGAEKSGHIILAEYSKTGDAIISCLKFLELYLDSDFNIEKELNDLQLFNIIEENVTLTEPKKSKLFNDSNFLQLISELEKTIYDQGRILVRPSGTEPIIRILVETNNITLGKLILKKIKSYIE